MRSMISRLAGAVVLVTAIPTASAQEPLQSYIVMLKSDTVDVPGAAQKLATAHGGQVGFVYEHALKGFSIELSPQAAAALAKNKEVALVEVDMPRSINEQGVPTGIQRIYADILPAGDGGLMNAEDDWRVDVDVAVIDTGIDWEHRDLNVVRGVNCASNTLAPSCSDGTGTGTGDDDHYHGTHVAGTIAALDNDAGVVGVAPGARLWAVKVLNSSGSGYTSWVIAGIDWVTKHASEIEVANMSLGGSGCSETERTAIANAMAAGVAFVVAAGNSDADAKNHSPACFEKEVLTVSALADFDGLPGAQAIETEESPFCRDDEDDTLANFSNWGTVVDIAAPGVCIESTLPGNKTGVLSGTSMASPHVAGAVALLLSRRDKPTNATAVTNLYDEVKSLGNLDWTDQSPDNVKERLLDVSDTSAFAPKLIPPTPSVIALSTTVTKKKNGKSVRMQWAGAKSTSVDIKRNDALRSTTNNDGLFDDSLGKGSGSATYEVCEAGTDTCSEPALVSW